MDDQNSEGVLLEDSYRNSSELDLVGDRHTLLPSEGDQDASQARSDPSPRWAEKKKRVIFKRSFPKCGAHPYSAFVFLASTVIIIFTCSWYWNSSRMGRDDAVIESTLDENYILNPDWDFRAKPTKREYKWTIQSHDRNPDGVFRPMMLINGAFPGPLIECNEGDTIIVHIHNQAVNSTSFHWHGIYQNGTNHMDGTVGITQCPIAPGGRFTYEFKIDGQAGTYWYHSHHGTQVSDGLFGPLIVHSKETKDLQKLNYASDRVVMVQDYYHDHSGELLMHYLEPDRENAEPVPDGALINGKNIRDCSKILNRKCDNSTAVIPEFNLVPNQNHRLRFINVGAFAEFQIQIDEHKLAVTEVDGTDVEPAYYHRLNISPGQRYSVVVSTNITSASSYWMRARMVTTCFAEPNPNLEPEVRAVIRYTQSDSPVRSKSREALRIPQSKDWNDVVELVCKDMNTTELIPTKAVPAPRNANAFFYLRSNFEIGAWKLSRGFFNTSSWRPDVRSPSLNRFIEGYAAKNQSFMSTRTGINKQSFDIDREMVIQVDGVQTIDILVDNFDDGNHPLHLHGYKYFVLAQGHGYFDYHMYETMDFSNPLRRDSAYVEAFGWILIRLVTDNPGMWAFHCHISWHMEAGMLMQFLTGSDVVGNWKLPEANKALCRADGLEKGNGPKDEIWYGGTG